MDADLGTKGFDGFKFFPFDFTGLTFAVVNGQGPVTARHDKRIMRREYFKGDIQHGFGESVFHRLLPIRGSHGGSAQGRTRVHSVQPALGAQVS